MTNLFQEFEKKSTTVRNNYNADIESVSIEFDGYGRGAILAITALVYLCLQVYRDDIPSLSITVTSQLQSGGLGSSAAFSVALSAALMTDSGVIELSGENHIYSLEEKHRINELSRYCIDSRK